MRLLRITLYILAIALAAAVPLSTSTAAGRLDQINHLIVIFQENWSFDGLYGKFPGANGLANAGAAVKQVDKNDQPYTTLPQPVDTRQRPPRPDPRFPPDLPVEPFNLAQFVSPTELAGNPVHEFYREQLQINNGQMNKFVAWSNVGGLVMSYYDATNWPVGRLAQQYVLADNFFHAAFGGSFLNHMWLICACTPTWADASAEMRATLDANGILVRDGAVTADGYAVNTSFAINKPHPATITDSRQLVPNQTLPTIGDRLTEKGISWVWYSGGWNDALAGNPHPLFQYHHQPFVYFANYADGKPAKTEHLRDEQDFLRDLGSNSLPAVSFIKALGPNNEHPNYSMPLTGQQHAASLIRAVMNSPYWDDVAIIVTYDENGGRWDHVAPPKGDRWGPGIRVPAIIISPHAKRGYVDHTLYDTTSILKFIEKRWNLRPLGARDAAANDLSNAFR